MRPLILVSNDDGILSPGIKAAAAAVQHLGDLLIVAPRYEQTAMSRSFPKGDGIGVIEQISLEIGGISYPGHAVYGSPAQSVSHAILELANRRPDLCVSGINYGENLGTSVIPSGTIGAALEASTYGVPGLVINLETAANPKHPTDYDANVWRTSEYFTNYFASIILREGLPKPIGILNVNIPHDATPATSIRKTRQSMQDYLVFKKPEPRDFTKAFRLKTEVKIDIPSLEPDSDIKACIFDKVVSVTPLVQNLTATTEWGKQEWA